MSRPLCSDNRNGIASKTKTSNFIKTPALCRALTDGFDTSGREPGRYLQTSFCLSLPPRGSSGTVAFPKKGRPEGVFGVASWNKRG